MHKTNYLFARCCIFIKTINILSRWQYSFYKEKWNFTTVFHAVLRTIIFPQDVICLKKAVLYNNTKQLLVHLIQSIHYFSSSLPGYQIGVYITLWEIHMQYVYIILLGECRRYLPNPVFPKYCYILKQYKAISSIFLKKESLWPGYLLKKQEQII